MQLTNGHLLQNGAYRIESKIGQGGFGITYRARWTTTVQGAVGAIAAEIPVVVKEFFWKDYCVREEGTSRVSISSATGKEMFARFKEKLKKEAKILSRLTHPHIVRVLDIFEENNTAYMVLQLVEGESLKDKIVRLGQLDEAVALKYTRQLCSALSEVHDKRILHLDVKPGNVMIDKNDNAQLLDFGISKQYDDRQKETSTTPLGISKGYAPLEQYAGIETFSPPTDVYALGATLYTMLTGEIPLEATQMALSELEPVRNFNPGVSDRTVAAIEKAMEMKPAKRFQTVRAFGDAIDGTDDGTRMDTPMDKIKPEPEPEPKPEAKPEPKPETEPDDTLLEKQPPTSPDGSKGVARNALTPDAPARNAPTRNAPTWTKFLLGMAGAIVVCLVIFYLSGRNPDLETSAQGVLINGVRWATSNVAVPGAFAARPEEAGMFYQWNRKVAWPATGKVSNWNSTTPAGAAWEKANDPCPAGWRMPALDKIEKLLDTDKVRNEWTRVKGVNGIKFTDKATGNSLFLPAAGYRDNRDGTLGAARSYGSYWSSTQYDSNNAYSFFFGSSSANTYDYGLRAFGLSCRCMAE